MHINTCMCVCVCAVIDLNSYIIGSVVSGEDASPATHASAAVARFAFYGRKVIDTLSAPKHSFRNDRKTGRYSTPRAGGRADSRQPELIIGHRLLYCLWHHMALWCLRTMALGAAGSTGPLFPVKYDSGIGKPRVLQQYTVALYHAHCTPRVGKLLGYHSVNIYVGVYRLYAVT